MKSGGVPRVCFIDIGALIEKGGRECYESSWK